MKKNTRKLTSTSKCYLIANQVSNHILINMTFLFYRENKAERFRSKETISRISERTLQMIQTANEIILLINRATKQIK